MALIFASSMIFTEPVNYSSLVSPNNSTISLGIGKSRSSLMTVHTSNSSPDAQFAGY
ncbi:MAG: hypothetical protein ACFFD4_00130 [Candidatus Odinarchaeota archaeon]